MRVFRKQNVFWDTETPFSLDTFYWPNQLSDLRKGEIEDSTLKHNFQNIMVQGWILLHAQMLYGNFQEIFVTIVWIKPR